MLRHRPWADDRLSPLLDALQSSRLYARCKPVVPLLLVTGPLWAHALFPLWILLLGNEKTRTCVLSNPDVCMALPIPKRKTIPYVFFGHTLC